ncbi:MAG: type IV toxin-antitoxin system AbiEi family antitoxin domain-containing protein [Bdellovibrionales bacterium]
MKSMTEFKKLEPLLLKPLFRASEANELGVSTSLLAYYIKQGLIERVARGVYRSPGVTPNVDFMWEDLVTTVNSIPSGVICLTSALSIYELTDEIPRKHWIAIPNSTTAPKRKNIKAVRMRDIKTEMKIMSLGEEKVKIFSIERTLVDSFRFLSKEVAIKALRAAIKGDKKIDLKKLQSIAKKLRVDINPYLMTVTT